VGTQLLKDDNACICRYSRHLNTTVLNWRFKGFVWWHISCT